MHLEGVEAHPACLPGFTTVTAAEITPANGKFCNAYADNPLGLCCTAAQEATLQTLYTDTLPAGASSKCQALHREVSCIACHPWATHLKPRNEVPLLCTDFCEEYVTECGLPANTCAKYRDGTGYCYPFAVSEAPVTDGSVQPYFTNIPADHPMFSATIAGAEKVPTRNAWYVWSTEGRVYEVPNDPEATATDVKLVLDHTEKTTMRGELGFLHIAFPPDFAATGCFYATYNDILRQWDLQLSKFCNGVETKIFTVRRLPNSVNHNGGWIGFRPEDLAVQSQVAGNWIMFMSVGDCLQSWKVADMKEPYGKMLRFEVGPAGLLDNLPDNPYYNVADKRDWQGKVWAHGLRNPFRCTFDASGRSDSIFCSIVGESSVEIIAEVREKSYVGWDFWEGDRCYLEYFTLAQCNASPPDPPIFQYCHSMEIKNASCEEGKVITLSGGVDGFAGAGVSGGMFYTGSEFSDTALKGSYIFADYIKRSINMITYDGKTKKWVPTVLYQKEEGVRHCTGIFDDLEGNIFAVCTGIAGDPTPGSIYKIGCGAACNTTPSEFADDVIVNGAGAGVDDDGLEETLAPTMAPTMAPTGSPTFA